ncbi:thymidylate synthase [Marinobacter sp. DUT-3]|uniref:thymidylate synthase n=1 Tax=Marinobacter sp. DUT-3 TaxID=3412036 RepID=UPI003D18004C
MLNTFNDVNQVQVYFAKKILEDGETCCPRGMETKELLGCSFKINNPRNRLTTLTERRWSLPLAIGELCWHLSGSDDVSPLLFYAKSWSKFSENGRVQGSCYGNSIGYNRDISFSQWKMVRQLLIRDPGSRRAIIFLNVADNRLDPLAKDVACVSSIQFIVRQGKLHAMTNMRSNDLILGLPYDVFLFSWLQELMASELGYELGEYYHNAASLHIYDRHYDLASRIVGSDFVSDCKMPKMDELESVIKFVELEDRVRKGAKLEVSVGRYWDALLSSVEYYSNKRNGRSGGKDVDGENFSIYKAIVDNMNL